MIKSLCSRFHREMRGGIALMGGLIIGVIGTGVIAAVDIADMTVSIQKVQKRVDSAVLFATLNDEYRSLQSAEALQTAARQYILNALQNSGLDLDPAEIATNFTYDEARDRIIGEVTFEPPAIFVGAIVAPRGLTVRAEAAPIETTEVEVSLVLDVSGSMNWSLTSNNGAPVGSRRIDALRDGVEALVTTLETNPQVDPRFAVVPYATSVDVRSLFDEAGAQQTTWFVGANGEDLPDLNQSPGNCGNGNGAGNAQNCPNNNNDDDNDDDDNGGNGGGNAAVINPSPTGAWGAERYVAKNGSSFTLSLAEPGATREVPVITQGERQVFIDDNGNPAEAVQVNGEWRWEKDYYVPRSGILGQTEDLTAVRSFMDGLSAQGSTAGHIGTAWGLYALSADWDPVFNHPAGKPAPFNGAREKLLVIMTDGDFTATHDNAIGVDESYDYFQAACALARQKGVTIYTVGLRSSALTDTELTNCAGVSDQYFSVDSRAELVEAFETIALNAARVRLSY